MHRFLLKSVPILSAASLSSFMIYTKVSAKSPQSITESQYTKPFETPEQYLKSMFSLSPSGQALSPIEPNVKEMLLSPQSIIQKLSKNAHTVHTKNNNITTHYQTNQYRANNPIEDTFDVRLKPNTKNLQGMLFGVFDGHSGTHCSTFCKQELLDFIEYSASTKDSSPKNFTFEDAIDAEIYCLSPSTHNEFTYLKQHNLLPFTRAFLLADTAFLFSVGDTEKDLKKANTGACGIVCHLDEIWNNTERAYDEWITTAWVGDCRAIVGRKVDEEWKCIELTCDHQINMNPKERNRLLREHPNEADIIKRNRVKGRLQPTRVFGDGHYKYMKFFAGWKNRLRYMKSAWTPPYVTAKPDISCYKVTANDEFIIVSTDGLFQDLCNEEIVQYVGAILDEKESDFGCDNVSTLLIRKALLEAGKYLDGRLNTDALNLSSVLNLHEKMKRSVHDDLTVITLFLNKEKNESKRHSEKTNNYGKDIKIPKTLKKLFTQQTTQSKL
eukprot:594997_1